MTTDLSTLAHQAASGDGEAFAALVSATHADVWRLCAYLVDQPSADDLAQETYLRAFRSISTFRGDAPIRAWLLTIARRTCAAELDARVRRRELALKVQPTNPARLEFAGAVDTGLLLAALQPERRLAFVLTQVIGCDYAEAAAICDVPVGTIRSRVARARGDLITAMHADTEITRARPPS